MIPAGKTGNSKNELFPVNLIDISSKGKDLFTLGSMAILAGAIGHKIFSLNDISYLLYTVGVLSCGYQSLTNQKVHKKLWMNTKLINDDGAMPTLVRKINRNFGYDMVFSLPTGLSTEDFEKKKASIEQHFNKKIEIGYANNKLILSIYTKKLEREYVYEAIETKKVTELVVGYSFGGKAEIVDLADCPHILIAGESGSGKSTLLRSIITTIILTKRLNDLDLHLIDFKRGAEFNIFRKCKMVKSFSRTTDEAYQELEKLSREVDRRYNLFFGKDVVDIKEYNDKFKSRKLKYKIVVIDEYADLQEEEKTQKYVEELGAKARACGIHLIVSTQRPDSKILNGRIKANISTIIGLKTMNSTNSRIIIDKNGLEELRGKGHGILVHKGSTEIQAMNLTPQQARDLLKSYYVQESNVVELKKTKKTKKKEAGTVEDFGFLKALQGGKK